MWIMREIVLLFDICDMILQRKISLTTPLMMKSEEMQSLHIQPGYIKHHQDDIRATLLCTTYIERRGGVAKQCVFSI